MGVHDIARIIVIAIGAVTLGIYIHTVFVGVRRWFNERNLGFAPEVMYILKGRIAEAALVAMMIGLFIAGVVKRLGNGHVDPATPILAFACIIAVYAWGHLHRKDYIPSVLGPAIQGTLDSKTPEDLHGPPSPPYNHERSGGKG